MPALATLTLPAPQELVGHPGLLWAAATHSLPPCAYLSQLGLHCSSGEEAASPTAWLRECACGGPAASPWGAAAPLLSLWTCGSTPAAVPPERAISRADLVQRLGGWLGLPVAHAPCLLSEVSPPERLLLCLCLPICGAEFVAGDCAQCMHEWGSPAAPLRSTCAVLNLDPLRSQAPPAPAPLASWAAYYHMRGLPPESPAALLLDATLTLYSAVVRLHRQLAALQRANGGTHRQHAGSSDGSFSAPRAADGSCSGGCSGGCSAAAAGGCELPLQQLPQLLPGGRLVLHLLGPQRELDQWPLLLELGCLLPRQLHIDLHLIGPDVPAAAHGRSLHVGAPAAGPCGRSGCSCAVAWRGVGQCAAGAGVQQETGAASGQQQPAASGEQQQGAGGMRLWFWRGAYHEVAPELALQHGPPHAVVAPNAGKLGCVAAGSSWDQLGALLLKQSVSSCDPGGDAH